MVENYALGKLDPHFLGAIASDGKIEQFQLDLTDDELLKLSQERRLALNLAEIQVLRQFCLKHQRHLSDAELEMLAQTWSEHCYHKTFRAQIHFQEYNAEAKLSAKKISMAYLNSISEPLPKPILNLGSSRLCR
ncbi:MAG: hypothetical protein R2865_12215 [Deinococcales bacterium]